MKIIGKVISRLEMESGEGKNGTWQKRTIVLETGDQYPKKIAVDCWGDLLNVVENLKKYETITAHIDIESREWQGRYFTNVRCWRIERDTPAPAPVSTPQKQETDDLPF